ncbi:hypothetical protein B0H19DRAFT_1187912 [Mycena capillaripes]|nr:hypothetical protein B0H19DRAFT_1187912 [Mycena capillaripes]
MAPVCGLLCPLTLFPVGRHAPLILYNAAFTNESALEQDVGKISGLAQTLQSPSHLHAQHRHRTAVAASALFRQLARTWVCASTLTQQRLACAMLHNVHGAREHTAWQPRPPRCSFIFSGEDFTNATLGGGVFAAFLSNLDVVFLFWSNCITTTSSRFLTH